jgi:diguanylate cyclase (GGDEF)-like protein
MKAVDFLGTVPLFSQMSALELKAVMELLDPRMYPSGCDIYEPGETGTEMFIVHSGTVSILEETADGALRETKRVGPRSFFGEMAVVSGSPRAERGHALEDTKVFVLSGLNFQRMVWDTPMLGVRLLTAMNRSKAASLAKASGFLDDMVRWGETARKRAVIDDLSGLFNRRFLEEAIVARICRGFGESRTCALLMIDFDRFREINAKYGLIAGDAVIGNVGATIQRLIGEGQIASRLSGDEFAIFLPDSGADGAMALANRLQEETASLYLEFRPGAKAKSERVTVTLSIGVAVGPAAGRDLKSLSDAADRALYRAKEGGRNRVCADSSATR